MTPVAARALVVAKAPVPGQAKTRLGAEIGMVAAADLAAAALLDTLQACNEVFEQGGSRYLALTGDLMAARRGEEIRQALSGWTVFDQQGDSFGERLAHAHTSVAGYGTGPVVQLGMDTPQVSAANLGDVVDELAGGAEVVLGPAEDGGWWVLGLADPCSARALVEVPMSTPKTYDATVEAFARAGQPVVAVAALRDVDTCADAEAVVALAPQTQFAQVWGSR